MNMKSAFPPFGGIFVLFSMASRWGLFSLASSVLAVTAAQAQDADSTASTVELDTILVQESGETGEGPVDGYLATRTTAGAKTDTPIMELPESVSVVPQEQIQDQDAHSVAQALRYTAGVSTEYRGSSNLHDETFIRGFYYAPRFLDGLTYGSDSYGQVDPFFLERIEVIKGPASVLYGQVSPGGIINLVSKRPTEETQREVQVQVGDHNRLQGAFDFSGGAEGVDNVYFRLVGIGNTFDLEEDYVSQERWGISPSFTWKPQEGTEWTVWAFYQNDPEAGFRNFMPTVGTVYPTKYGYIPRSFFVSDPDFQDSTKEQFSVESLFEHDLNETFTVRQRSRYSYIDQHYATLVFLWEQADQVTLSRLASEDWQTMDQFVTDTQLESNFVTGFAEHTLLSGIDTTWSGVDYKLQRGFNVPSIDWRNPVYGVTTGALDVWSDDYTTTTQIGTYIQDQIDINDLHIMVGGRYDWAKTDVDNHIGSDSEIKDSEFTWRAGAIYDFGSGVAPYVSYSTSFEPEMSTGAPGTAPFDPTTGQQIEAGIKWEPVGYDLLFTLSAYQIRQQNVVAYDSTIGFNVQIGEIESRGLELEGRGSITDELSFIAAYSLVDSTVLDSGNAAEVGKVPPRVPGQQAALWAKYEFAEGTALHGLSLGGGVRYIGTSWGDRSNTYKVAATTLFDAMISYDLGKVNPSLEGASLQLNASNLADTRYVASCAGIDSCFYGSGRTITGTLTYRW